MVRGLCNLANNIIQSYIPIPIVQRYENNSQLIVHHLCKCLGVERKIILLILMFL